MTIAPSRWTAGPVRGKPDESGHVRWWSAEDAHRLATKGEVLTPASPIPFKVRTFGRLIAGDPCDRCGKLKVITTRAAGAWCFGCGRVM